jgi:MFS family permease
VALPSISTGLHAGPSDLEWIVTGYGLTYGVALVTGARLGDRFGRRRLFLVGAAAFTAASALCGVAPTPGTLIVARVAQGLAAAALTPQVLATISTVFEGKTRARAIDAFAATVGLSAVAGQLLGGLLVRADLFGLGWRSCFLVNLPVGIGLIVAGWRYLPQTARHTAPVDTVGTGLLGAALTLLVLPIIEGRTLGWPLWTWVSMGASAVVLSLFVRHQQWMSRRPGTAPLLQMSLFRSRAFSAGLLLQMVLWAGQSSVVYTLAQYSQRGLGLDPLESGALFCPLGVGYILTSMTARYAVARFGRQVIAAGAFIMVLAEALLLVSVMHTTPHQPALLIGPLFLFGAGTGFAVSPLAGTVMAGVDPVHAGTASGALAAGMQVGNAIGVALIGVVFYSVAEHSGYHAAFLHVLPYTLGVTVVIIVLAQLLPARRRSVGS